MLPESEMSPLFTACQHLFKVCKKEEHTIVMHVSQALTGEILKSNSNSGEERTSYCI